MSLPELTPEELAYYASLNLAEPDADALAAFLTESQANTDGAAAAADPADRHDDHSEAAASRFDTCPTPRDGSITSDAAALSLARPATSSTAAALARRRLSGSPLLGAPSAAAATGGPRATRYGVTQLLDADGLVGGVAGMADAALQTRCVELPGRHLTTTLPIQCFLNVTHVYLQHNALADLDGMELLSQLQVLVAHHNQLTSLTPLKELERVVYVDASFNRLTEPVARLLRDALPCATLQSLDLRHNPFLDAAGAARQQAYRSEVCAACPALERLDGEDVDSSDTDTDASGDSEAGSSGRASAAQEVAARGRDSLRSRRVLGAIAAARAAAASTPPPLQPPQQPQGGDASSSGSDAEVRLDPGADAAAAAEVVVAPRPHTAAAYRAAALLEEEQTRLVHQLRARHAQASSKATAEVAAVSTTRASSASVSESGDTAPAVSSAAELLPVLESEPTDVVSAATHADALLLYQNLQYTQAVGQARLQRDVAAHWDDVARVLQTAQALHQDRRRRLQQRLQEATPAYAESLRLLQQESYVPDLAGYRSGKLVAAARARDGKHAAAAPLPAPPAGPGAASQVPSAGPAAAVSRNRPTPETRRRPPAPPAAPAATAARSASVSAARTPPPAPSPAPTAVAPASAPPRWEAKQRASAAKLAPKPPPQPRRK